MRLAIVGAGWYGCHLALELKKAGHDVVLYEKNDKIFSQISGEFGIRLHAGPHYPRSEETRKSCKRGLEEFKLRYPDLIIPHEYSIYALGKRDADGNPSKVNEEQFKKVCEESESCRFLDPDLLGYTNLITAATIDEPSIALGSRLRVAFEGYLKEARVEVVYNYDVEKIENKGSEVFIGDKDSSRAFDKVINTTSYQSLVPNSDDFPFDMDVIYQPCLALVYKDKKPGVLPFSFIVMDGWFPCLMPIWDDSADRKYILTHGSYTIMGTYGNPAVAKEVLANINDELVKNTIKPLSEHEMGCFWPGFSDRFEYVGWKGAVLAKIKTKSEFRSAITYEKDNIIQIIPGKVSNIFDVEREVKLLLKQENVLWSKDYLFVQNGVLDQGLAEIMEKPSRDEPNTGNLHTLDQLIAENFFGGSPSPVASPVLEPRATSQIAIPEFNYYFLLECLVTIAATLALLALAIIMLSSIGIIASAAIGSAAVVGGAYNLYRLFSKPKENSNVVIEEQLLGEASHDTPVSQVG
jgi:hypothetical protein